MLDDFHHGRRVESGQALVAIHQRTVQQLDASALHLGQAIQVQPVLGNLQRAMGDVHADDFLELPLLEQHLQQFAFATAKVENAPCAAVLQCGQHRAEALFVQADALLNLRLFLRVALLRLFG